MVKLDLKCSPNLKKTYAWPRPRCDKLELAFQCSQGSNFDATMPQRFAIRNLSNSDVELSNTCKPTRPICEDLFSDCQE